jgi:hypothetical protein
MSSTLDVEDFRPRSTVSHESDAIQQFIRDCKRLKPNLIIMVAAMMKYINRTKKTC